SPSTATQTIAKLTFSGALTDFTSLADGRYRLTVNAANITDGGGLFLDGNGDNVMGDNYVSSAGAIFRLFGDADGNATVDGVDFGAFRTAFNTAISAFDFDNSGQVDGLDFGQFRARFGMSV